MNVFKEIMRVQHAGVVSTLSWDGEDAAVLEGEFLGMKSTTEKTRAQAQRDVLEWRELVQAGELTVTDHDRAELDRLMEGVEGWEQL